MTPTSCFLRSALFQGFLSPPIARVLPNVRTYPSATLRMVLPEKQMQYYECLLPGGAIWVPRLVLTSGELFGTQPQLGGGSCHQEPEKWGVHVFLNASRTLCVPISRS